MVGIGIFTACQQEEFAPDVKIDEIANDYVPEGDPMVLGRQLENPYSVENMKEALNNLKSNGRVTENVTIETTHLYIRFLPKDTVEIALLESDTTLELFDYPLDFEIEKIGNWYHDPAIPNNLPTWQYTVVTPDFAYPNVKYEILANLFLVDDEEENGRVSSSFWDNLETEALRITGNLDAEEIEDNTAARHRRKWNPSGRIRVEERLGGADQRDVPVRYCKVRAQRWFKWGSANTSVSNGSFRISKQFRREVNYSLKFETAGFKVTNFFGFATKHNGPKIKGAWNLNIAFSNGSESWVRATFINAIYDFRTQASRHRIKLPGVLVTVKVRPVFKNGTSNAVGVIRHIPGISILFRNDVRIFTKRSNGSLLETDDLYSVVMHELGHVSHFLKSPANTIWSIGITGESWAEAVEYYFTLPYYRDVVTTRYNGNNPNALFEGNNDLSRTDIIDGGNRSWKYTPFFIDLRDNTNQRNIHNGNVEWADDDVSGYTLEQMQTALNNRTKMSGVCEYLRKEYNNPTENNLYDVLEFYTDIKNNH